MSAAVLKRTLEKVFASGLVGRVSVSFGTPVSRSRFQYRSTKRRSKLLMNYRIKKRICHSIQTNGTLINDGWCEFIKNHDIRIGLSIDGPELVHDAHRKDRRGQGTHARVMEGVRCLRKHGIDFHVIAVVTERSLDYPDEVFNFFLENGMHQIGFNIEEIEGTNASSTLSQNSGEQRSGNSSRESFSYRNNLKVLSELESSIARSRQSSLAQTRKV